MHNSNEMKQYLSNYNIIKIKEHGQSPGEQDPESSSVSMAKLKPINKDLDIMEHPQVPPASFRLRLKFKTEREEGAKHAVSERANSQASKRNEAFGRKIAINKLKMTNLFLNVMHNDSSKTKAMSGTVKKMVDFSSVRSNSIDAFNENTND